MVALSQYYAHHALAVNLRGERFCDERRGFLDEVVAQEGGRQPEARYFLLFDAEVRERAVAGDAAVQGVGGALQEDRLELLRGAGGFVWECASLDALCRELAARGVDGERLRATPRGGRPRQGALLRGRVRDITTTTGGLRVDPELRVLGARGAAPGLHAAGADAGRVFAGVTGGCLAGALVSEIVAARTSLGSR